MLLNHSPGALAYDFDDPNLIGSAGLLPVMRLAEAAGLSTLAPQRLSLSGDTGANSPAKIASLVAGMSAGADSIDDMGSLRHGAMPGLFRKIYAPSTLGSFLREFSVGHVQQLDALSSRLLAALGSHAPLLHPRPDCFPRPETDAAPSPRMEMAQEFARLYAHSSGNPPESESSP